MSAAQVSAAAMPVPAMFAVSPSRSLQTRLTLAVLATLVVAFGLFYALMERALGEDARALLAQQQRATVALLASQAGMALEVRLRALEQVASDLAAHPHWDGRQAQALLRERPVLQTLFNTDVLAVRHDGSVLTSWPLPAPEHRRVAPPVRVPSAAPGAPARRIWVDTTQGVPVLMLSVPVHGAGSEPAGALVGRERTAGVGFLDALLSAAGQLPGRYAVLHWPTPGAPALALAQWRTPSAGGVEAPARAWSPGEAPGAEAGAADWLRASHAIAATDWAVAAQAPLAELLAPAHQRQQRALLATLGIALGAGALCGWAIRRQLAPMRRAIATLATQAQSYTPQALRLDARGRDEVGVLIQGFNRVLDAVDQRERALAQSRQRLDDILNHLEPYVYLKDAQGRYQFANRSLCQALGRTSEQVLGCSDADFFDASTCAQLQTNDRQVLQAAGPLCFDETTAHRGGGVARTYLSVKLPIRNPQGEVEGLCGISTDISERKQRERQRLQQEAAHRAALVREVHHRIKNNLQGILALLRQHAQRHPELAAPLQQAIGQVQSISTLHGLQGRSAQAQVELGELVQAIAREVALLWECAVPVQALPAWTPTVVAEREAVPLALVLHELLLNAVKHSSDPGLGVPVRLQCLPDGGREIQIRNPGQWPADPVGPGQGLGLIAALLPRQGASLQQSQDGAWVLTRLCLHAPVLHSAGPPLNTPIPTPQGAP